ncbi:MAG: hypothetical protein JNK58_00455 [Phycisphaerae bacterium]|nr:hypothetical protein [Phycisphaerae bacterium]
MIVAMQEVRTIHASQVAGAPTPVESATRLAALIEKSLTEANRVEVRLHGLRGLSSSYFNALLEHLVNAIGRNDTRDRVRFLCETEAQRQTWERSARWLDTQNQKP